MAGARAAVLGAAVVLAIGLVGGLTGNAGAADLLVPGPAVPDAVVTELPEGVPCESPVVQAFPSVWLGHFTGGYSHYLGEGGPIVLDWRDEKLCFQSNRSCNRYIHEMRRDFHRPEGYFTCLPIR